MSGEIHFSIDNTGFRFAPEFYLVMVNNSLTIQGNPQHRVLRKLDPFQVFLS